MRASCRIWTLLLASGAATFAAAQAPQTLGGAVSRLEAGLAAAPEAAAAGPAATARSGAGIVGGALSLWDQSRHLDTPYSRAARASTGVPGW